MESTIKIHVRKILLEKLDDSANAKYEALITQMSASMENAFEGDEYYLLWCEHIKARVMDIAGVDQFEVREAVNYTIKKISKKLRRLLI